MQLTQQTLSTINQNLAWDQWLLDELDSGEIAEEVLRIWEPDEYAVVLGRSSRWYDEVNHEWVSRNPGSLSRRCSGGAAVVIGPGCLVYSLVLSYEVRPHFKMIDRAHQEIMETFVNGFQQLGLDAQFQGTCDLTHGGKKFSGNSLRCKRNSLLYHGTVLYDFPLELISAALQQPPRQPDYRDDRPHADFVTNLDVVRQSLVEMIGEVWDATPTQVPFSQDAIDRLVRQRYDTSDWINSR